MVLLDPRWAEYISEPNSLEYRGFAWIITEQDTSGNIHLTFKNGRKKLTVKGTTKTEAYKKIFDEIDNYLESKVVNF